MRIQSAKGIAGEMFPRSPDSLLLQAPQISPRPGNHLDRTRPVTSPRQGIIHPLPLRWGKIQHRRQVQIQPHRLHHPPRQATMLRKPLDLAGLGQIFSAGRPLAHHRQTAHPSPLLVHREYHRVAGQLPTLPHQGMKLPCLPHVPGEINKSPRPNPPDQIPEPVVQLRSGHSHHDQPSGRVGIHSLWHKEFSLFSHAKTTGLGPPDPSNFMLT